MDPLHKTLRNRLERAIKDARDIAEDAARAALEQLGVGEATPFTHLSEPDRELHRRLRVHARQLGDVRHAKSRLQQKLERLVANLPLEVFTASDSLGWVYQFWQARKKDEVNASEVKIGARELPAVTQLFTEPCMVSFLLDNSLGAWWAARRLTETDLQNASSEEELRQQASILGVPLEYLRFVQQEDGAWTPAAGTFDCLPT